MTLSAVQTNVFDTFGAFQLGQLATFSDYHQSLVRSTNAEDNVFIGRGVVFGDANDRIEESHIGFPTGVKPAETSSVSANIAGVVVASQRSQSDANNDPFLSQDTMVGVAEVGSGLRVAVKNSVAITHGQDVYMAVNPTNAANIAVGEFHNASGAGLVQVTGASWRGSRAANSVTLIQL